MLKRKGEASIKENPERRLKKTVLPEEVWKFLDQISWDWDRNRLELQKERLYYLPEELPDRSGLRLLRNGLLLGELKKNRFEPSQALAMALKREEFSRTVSLQADDERVIRYLKGETIELEGEQGLVLVCVDGYPLGWGKRINGILKNKYLAGWRWLS